MSKTKKVTFNMIAANISHDNNAKELEIEGGYKIAVTYRLGLKEYLEFVNAVVQSCYDEDDGIYNPEVRYIAEKIYLLVYYAGIDKPKDVSKAYDVVCNTTIYDRVFDLIDQTQWFDMQEAIDDKIAYFSRRLTSAAVSEVNRLIAKTDEMLSMNNDMINQLKSDDVAEMIRNMEKYVSDASADTSKTVDGSMDAFSGSNVVMIPKA